MSSNVKHSNGIQINKEDIGIHSTLNDDFYHSIRNAISKSGLDQINKSPQHYIYWLENPPEPTKAMEKGTAVHFGILEPKEFYKKYCAGPDVDKRTKAGKETWENFVADNEGKKILTADDFSNIERIVESVYSHKTASSLLKGGTTEATLIWEDPEEKVLCRGRADYLRNDGILVDVKTTDSAHQDWFVRSIFNYRYHVQSSFYSDAIATLTGKKLESYIMIAVEKEPPYGIGIYVLDDFAIEAGRIAYKKNLKTYAECLKTNKWPGYSSEIITVEAPKWVS